MLTLEETLIRNYNEITQPEGLGLVVDFIGRNPSVADKTFDFIKQITKVAYNILALNNSLEGFEERLYEYCQYGIKIGVDARATSNGQAKNAIAHLFSYSGNFSRIIFNRTHDVYWAERWYDANRKSADMTVESEPKHSAHTYTFAGNAAEALFEVWRGKDNELAIMWAERWYDAKRKSADMTVESDPKHSAHAYGFAGNAAYELYKLTRKEDCRKSAIDCYRQFSDYFEKHPYKGIQNVLDEIKERLDLLSAKSKADSFSNLPRITWKNK